MVYIDGVVNPVITLYRGNICIWHSDGSNTGHPLYFSEVADGPTHPDTTYAITAAGGKFYVDGVVNPVLTLYEGRTYTFDQSDSTNASHPFYFSETANGTHAQTNTSYSIAVNGSTKYTVDGNAQQSLTLYTGRTYTFNFTSSMNTSHPFKIGTSADTNNHLTTGVTYNSTSTVFTPTTAGTYYYYCDYHGNMGGTITVSEGSTKYTNGFSESGTQGW